MGFVGCIPRFLKAYGGWVLTALSSAGLVGTVILAAKEAPKAQTELIIAQQEKVEEWVEKHPDMDVEVWEDIPKEERELTLLEKAKVVAPVYLPAILLGTGTLACIFGAQIFNMKKQAALVSAYGMLAAQFDQYREAIKAEHGEEADRRAYEFSKKRVQNLEEEIQRLKEENGPYLYGIATLPGVIFEAKPVDIQEAIYHFNRNLALRGDAGFDELYRFIGIPETAYDEALAASFGYNEYLSEVNYGMRTADFIFESVVAKNGKMVHIIVPVIPPYRIAYINTDCDWDENDPESYPDYNPKRAKELATNVLNPSQLTRIQHELIGFEQFWYCANDF